MSSRFRGFLFEQRHYRRLIPLVALLLLLAATWCMFVLVLGLSLGGRSLIWTKAFAQSVLANLLVLPVALVVGVVVGTLIQRHSLRFQVRHEGDRLRDCVSLEVFRFIVFLKQDCGLPIDLEGPVDHRLVSRARDTAARAFEANMSLPAGFARRLYDAADGIVSCIRRSNDLRLAFPRTFDLMEEMEKTVADIRSDERQSPPMNTALIVLGVAARIVHDLE